MELRTLLDYYRFGTQIRFLQDCRPGVPVHGDAFVLVNIGRLFDRLDELGMPVTKRVAKNKLSNLIANLEGSDDDEKMGPERASELSKAIIDIRITLEAELHDIGAYSPTPKRIDLQRLLDNVGELFAPNVFDSLPEIARYDFQEAGKCIAFERPTAAAFHILRSTEDVLRFYYKQMIRQGRIRSLNWGPIVNNLRQKNRTKKYDVLNNHLDNIRASFRNPTQHPEATYDISEVQDLWSVCVDVVNRMLNTLRDEERL